MLRLMKGTFPPFGVPSCFPMISYDQPPKISYEGYPSKVSLDVDYGCITLYRKISNYETKDKMGISGKFGKFVSFTNEINIVEIVFNFGKYGITGFHLEKFIIDNPEFYEYLYNHCHSYYDDDSDDEDKSVFIFNDYESNEFKSWIDKIVLNRVHKY